MSSGVYKFRQLLYLFNAKVRMKKERLKNWANFFPNANPFISSISIRAKPSLSLGRHHGSSSKNTYHSVRESSLFNSDHAFTAADTDLEPATQRKIQLLIQMVRCKTSSSQKKTYAVRRRWCEVKIKSRALRTNQSRSATCQPPTKRLRQPMYII
jgi:hypothetical protein